MTRYYATASTADELDQLVLLDPANLPGPNGIKYGDEFRSQLPPKYVKVRDLPYWVNFFGYALTVEDIQGLDFTKLYGYAAILTGKVAAVPDGAKVRWEAWGKARCQEPYDGGIVGFCIWIPGGQVLWLKGLSVELPTFSYALIGEGGICVNHEDPSYETAALPPDLSDFSNPQTFLTPGTNCAQGYVVNDVWGGYILPLSAQLVIRGYRLTGDVVDTNLMPMTLPDPPTFPPDVPPPDTIPCCDNIEAATVIAQTTADEALAAAAAAQATADEALADTHGGHGVCELTPKTVTRNKFNPLTGQVELTSIPVFVPKDGDNDMGSMFNEILESLQALIEQRVLPLPTYIHGGGTIGPEV